MTIAAYRPNAPAHSILDELVCTDPWQRFRACEAVCAAIWAAGLNCCASDPERTAWRMHYARYLSELRTDLWTHERLDVT